MEKGEIDESQDNTYSHIAFHFLNLDRLDGFRLAIGQLPLQRDAKAIGLLGILSVFKA